VELGQMILLGLVTLATTPVNVVPEVLITNVLNVMLETISIKENVSTHVQMVIMLTITPKDVNFATEIVLLVPEPLLTNVPLVKMTITYLKVTVINHVQSVLITLNNQTKLVKFVTKDVLFVLITPIKHVLNVTTHGY
jgi:hypothetical protein